MKRILLAVIAVAVACAPQQVRKASDASAEAKQGKVKPATTASAGAGSAKAAAPEPKSAAQAPSGTATDPSTGGRNFSNHYCFPQWNVVPVSSPIEVQYGTAIGTAHVQRRHKSKALTIVTGGDAGTAEGAWSATILRSAGGTCTGSQMPENPLRLKECGPPMH